MAHRGPVITTVVVLGGLLGLMTANSVGERTPAAPTAVSAPSVSSSPPVTTKPEPPATTSKPAPRFPEQVVYAGKAKNSRVAIAVAVKGDRSAAYLCDGRDVEAWLRGSAKDGTVDLRSKSGGSRLVGHLSGDRLVGTITLSTQDHEFSIAVAPPPAGLYRARNGSTTIGWIVLPDGSQVGVETTGTTSKAAPELDTARGAVPVAGDTTFE